ncbi:uncharacterized protein LOC144665142 [Oculina patagonica]
MNKATFDQYVQLAKDAFKALGVNTNPVDAVGGLTESDFPTERVRQLDEDIKSELQADKKFLEEEVKDELQGIRSDIAQSNQVRQRDLIEAEAERKKEFKELTNQLQVGENALKEEIRKTAEKNIKANREITEKLDDIIKSKESGTKVSLPGSCLPPIVPHFTGRESECNVIIDHVMSESTRIVSIWGSPGFGKTSVAIALGHHLQSEGLPVYFLSLRGLQSKADLTSRLLSFFSQPATNGRSSQHLSLDDELCQLFTKVSDRFLVILDNADELFQTGTPNVKEEVVNLLEELLRRNEGATFVLTTRESLEFMNVHFQGHQAVRIRPLDEDSSENLVHQLLPDATTSDSIRLTQICGHVPLAIKLLCSSISEDNVQTNQFLDELVRDTDGNIIDMLDNPDFPSNLRLKFLFDSSFQRLSAGEKEALVCLSILPENFDQDVAAAVLNQTRISATKTLRSLGRKSLLDSSSKPGSFSMHTLIQSFAREKGEREMKETVDSSKARFFTFCISQFEKLNQQFLTGNSMSAFIAFYEDKHCIVQSLIQGCLYSSTADSVFRLLTKTELFIDSLFWTEGNTIVLIYDSAIQAAHDQKNNVFYRRLLASRAFFEVTWGGEGRTMQLLSKANEIQTLSSLVVDEEKGKNMCFSGMCQLAAGKTVEGVQQLKEALYFMKDVPEQTVLRLVAIQILAIYYRFKENWSSYSHFFSKALQESRETGGTQLIIIPPIEGTENKTDEGMTTQEDINVWHNQPLLLEILFLVSKTAKTFSDNKSKKLVSDVTLKILQENERAPSKRSLGLANFQRNVVCMLRDLNKLEDAVNFSEARIKYHQNALTQCNSNRDKYPKHSKHSFEDPKLHQEMLGKIYVDLYKVQCRVGNYSKALQSQQHALDIRLGMFGEEHPSTADSYHSLGVTQHAQGDLASALQSKQRALDIRRKLFGEEHSCTADSYHSLGDTQHAQGDLASALQSKQRALEIRRKLFGEEHSSTADSYHSLGDTQHAQGDLASALQSKQRAFDIRRKLFGEEHASTADSYHSLRVTQHAQGDLSSALQSCQRALDIRRKLFGEEHSSTADSYYLLGATQHSQGDLSSALQSCQRALDIRRKLFGEEHSSTADSYHSLGVTQHSQGDLSSALQSCQCALDIRRKLFGEEHSNTADSYHSLSATQHSQGDLSSALQSCQRALDIRRRLFGEEHSSTAHSYHSLSAIQHSQCDLSSALQSCQRALDIRRKLFGEEHSSTAHSYHSLSAIQHSQGDLSSALQSCQRALDIRRKLFGEEHSSTAHSYHSLSAIQYSQGDLSSALQSCQRALDIRRRLFGEEHSSTAHSYHSLSAIQHSQGNLTSALQSCQRALEIRRKLFGEEHSSTAHSHDSLGATQYSQGDLSSALQSCQRALDIRRKLFGEEHSSTAHSYHSLSATQHSQGDLSSALQSCQHALDIRRKLFGEEHPSTADSYESLGVTQHAQGDLSSALQSFQHALDIRRKLFGEEHPSTADSYESLGVTQHAQGDLSSALQSFQRALDIRQKLFGEKHPKTAKSYLLIQVTLHKIAQLAKLACALHRVLISQARI